jgi:hypothetical protein
MISEITTKCNECGSYNYLNLATPESPRDFGCKFCGKEFE